MRVLIVRLSSLGDVVHAAPVLTDLHRAHPGVQIDWVVEEAFVPLVNSFAGIDRIVPIALRRWRRDFSAARPEIAGFWHALRDERYDAVLDLQGLVKSGVVTRAARLAPGGHRVGLANRTDGSAYEPLARLAYDTALAMPPRTHVVDRSRELAARALGHAIDGPPVVPWQPEPLATPDARWADARAVLLVHASAKSEKLLPSAFWAELGATLVAAGSRVLLPWGNAAEQARAAEIAQEIGPGAAVLPRLPLDRLASVLARLHGSIGLDTGLSHMSATLGRPTVQLFIEDKAWRAAAYWEPATAVLQASPAAPPSVAQVIEAWERVA